MTLSVKLHKILIQGGSWKTILGGLWVTIQISALALISGTILGTLTKVNRSCSPHLTKRRKKHQSNNLVLRFSADRLNVLPTTEEMQQVD